MLSDEVAGKIYFSSIYILVNDLEIMHHFVNTNKVNFRISRTNFVQFFMQSL
jgi:hypothetical protein